jgi:hypothetical protein
MTKGQRIAFEGIRDGNYKGSLFSLKQSVGRIPNDTQQTIIDTFNKAKDITNDTFFDYSNVNEFERAVMKRVFPFWTFFSRNAEFWINKAFDPETAGNVAIARKLDTNLGRPLTEKEKEGAPDFLLKRGARVSDDGEFILPRSSSLTEAISTLTDPSSSVANLSPLIKAPVEVMANKDFFTGDVLFPNERDPKARIFDGSVTLLERILPESISSQLNIFRDENGRAYTNSSLPSILNKVISIAPVLPPRIIDDFERAMRRAERDDEPVVAEFFKQALSPVREFKISKKDMIRNRKRNKRNRKKLEAENAREFFNKRRKKKKLELK